MTEDARSQVYDDLVFAMITLRIAERTIVCSPELESRVKSRIDAMGISGLTKVQVSRNVPDDYLIVMDENALEAARNQEMQAMRARWSS